MAPANWYKPLKDRLVPQGIQRNSSSYTSSFPQWSSLSFYISSGHKVTCSVCRSKQMGWKYILAHMQPQQNEHHSLECVFSLPFLSNSLRFSTEKQTQLIFGGCRRVVRKLNSKWEKTNKQTEAGPNFPASLEDGGQGRGRESRGKGKYLN